MRERGETNSVRSRKFVGYLFSGYLFKPAFDIAMQAPGDLFCVDGQLFVDAPLVFYVHFHETAASVYFINLVGRPVIDEKKIDVPRELFEDMPGAAVKNASSTGFENEDNIFLSINHSQMDVVVKSAFGDESLNGNYKHTCTPSGYR